MRIERVELRGFGRLCNHAVDFHEGLNVVCGPNEAGKSTLLEAIQALLYGFSDAGNAREHNRWKSQFRPWAGGHYGGTLHLQLARGEQYRIVRDFAREITTVYQYPGATDRTDLYAPGRHGWIGFADRHLGFPRAVFRASARIDQADLVLAKDDISALKIKLERLTDSAGVESSALEATQRLDTWLRDRVNPRGFLATTSPLRKARDDAAKLREELARSRGVLDSLDDIAVDERNLESELERLNDEIEALNTALARLEFGELEDRLRRHQAVDGKIEAVGSRLHELDDVANLTQTMLDEARKALDAVDGLWQRVEQAEDLVARESSDREQASQEVADVEGRLTRLPLVASNDLTRVDEAVGKWRDAERDVESARKLVDQDRDRFDTLSASDSILLDVPATVDPDDIATAIRDAEAATRLLQVAESDATMASISPQIEGEFDRIDGQLTGLTAERVEELRRLENQIDLATVARPGGLPVAAVVVGTVAALVGIGVGWVILGIPGALVAGIALGVLGFLITSNSQKSIDAGPNSHVEKSRSLLRAELSRLGASTVDDLQRAWNRRMELAGLVQRARECRQTVANRKLDLERTIDRLAVVAGTREIERAQAIHRALLTRQAEKQGSEISLRASEERLAQASRTLADAREATVGILASLGITADTPSVAMQHLAYLRQQQLERSALLKRKTELEAEIRRCVEHEEDLVDLKRQLDESRSVARRFLATVGVGDAKGDARQALELRCERFAEYQAALNERQRHLSAREALIGTDDPQVWRQRRDALREQVSSVNADDTLTREDLHRRLGEVTDRRDRVTWKHADLRAQRQAALNQIREPALIEEELALVEQDLARLERLAKAIEGARDLLTKVAEEHRRNFAPRLADGIGEALARVTGDRYREVAVDPADLTIRVKSAERGDLIGIEHLSHGTRDAVALLLRTSVVDLLSSGDEPVPLFLDDPLVHVDFERTIRLLDLIRQLASRQQVFYFTQDVRIVDWAKSCLSGAIHELGGL
jgi:DNA repair exonuclease SbcCD ATPase subunit